MAASPEKVADVVRTLSRLTPIVHCVREGKIWAEETADGRRPTYWQQPARMKLTEDEVQLILASPQYRTSRTLRRHGASD